MSCVALGITTAPRTDSQLMSCVRSLFHADAETVRLFAEPGCDLASLADFDARLRIDQNDTRLGAWHNWRTMCRTLLAENTSPIILTVQDDTIFSRDALTTLAELWPTRQQLGFLSLYTPSHYQRSYAIERDGRRVGIAADARDAARKARQHRGATVTLREAPLGVNTIKTRSLWGACALAFPRDVLAQVIDHPIARAWQGVASRRRRSPRQPWEIANVDTAIGRILNAIGLRMDFVNPSLAQHAAQHSTLGHGGLGGRRQAWRVADDLLTVASGSVATNTPYRLTPPSRCCGG